jgi:hypothetical protein
MRPEELQIWQKGMLCRRGKIGRDISRLLLKRLASSKF